MALPDGGGEDPLLNTKQIQAETGLGHDGVKRAIERGELSASRGPRGQILVARSELRRYLTSKPVQPRTRKAAPPDDLASWEAQAERELRAITGGKR